MTTITEVAPDVYRISTFVPAANLEFAQFLVRDEEPLLFHTGLKALFPAVREAVASVMDPAKLRWLSFSHFEADECGALNEWLALASKAEAACNLVAAAVSVDDFTGRPSRVLADGEVLVTGKQRFRFLRTPHVPHCWEAGLLFEETNGILFCSDLFQQNGERPATTESDVVGPCKEALLEYQEGPFAHYLPYTPNTDGIFQRLSGLKPSTLATMHGAVFHGDGGRALVELAGVMREVLGRRRD
ncbi:MAG: MBL fold metallo-hydrolase [Planctomycetota bacterium]|nr:MAG: MBL fold metallo-hydrolase [Planctomycetota bacterium]